ncbi:MAG: LytTR family DNA-binding domain-containing protein [Chitinophagaceae bacterium]
MIRAVIVDDEENNIGALKSLLSKFCPEVEVVGTAGNAKEASTVISDIIPQLVFLDIEMPFGNGFTLIEKMMPVSFEVIFVTDFDQYAITAFKYAALDYLLKPVNIEDLKRAVNRSSQRIAEKSINNRIESLINNFRSEVHGLKKIGLPTAEGLIFEEIENIIHLQAESNYTLVFIKNKKKMTITKSLKEFEDILPASTFCRLHHSHIVNLNYITKYYKGRGGYVELTDGTTVEVSTRKKDDFLEKFKI